MRRANRHAPEPAAELAAVRRRLVLLRRDAGRLRSRLKGLCARTTAAAPRVPPEAATLRAELRFLEAFLGQMLAEEVAELERDLAIAVTTRAADLDLEGLAS